MDEGPAQPREETPEEQPEANETERQKILNRIAYVRAEASVRIKELGAQVKTLKDPEKRRQLREKAQNIRNSAAARINELRKGLGEKIPGREEIAAKAKGLKGSAREKYGELRSKAGDRFPDIDYFSARAGEFKNAAAEKINGAYTRLRENAPKVTPLRSKEDFARLRENLPGKEQIRAGAQAVKNGAGDLFDRFCEEIRSIRERDPAAESDLEVMLFYPGLHAVLSYRAAHLLYTKGLHLAAVAVSRAARDATGIEIHPAAQIGKNLFIDHGSAVVIGETAVIGDNCTIYQGVTLGGTGKHVGKRHPTIGNNVMIGAGAKVLGPVTVGDNAKIAAGAVVLKDIPANCTAVGIPAKIVRENGEATEQTLDQCNIPDPVAQELASLRERISALEKKSND
ncbi:MAG: serine O-acetyltransferase [Clostridia bacterium]|nr:serine O-acetyltransferase [Clostridia bacterium]